MSGEMPMKAIVVPATGTNSNQNSMRIALSNPDGSAAATVKPQTAPVNSTASTVGAMVTDFNALLAVLKTAGVLK